MLLWIEQMKGKDQVSPKSALAPTYGVVHISTNSVPASQRLEYWLDMVSSVMFNMTVSSPVKDNFQSYLTIAPLDALLISTIEGSERIYSRTRRNISCNVEECYYITVDFCREWHFERSGEVVRLGPGDLIITDLKTEYSARCTPILGEPRTAIKMPARWTMKWLRDPDSLVGKRIPGNQGWGKALSAYVRQLKPGMAVKPNVDANLIVDQFGALLSLVEAQLIGTVASAEPNLTAQIEECVRSRSCEQGLSATEVAVALGTSKRTLHRHLAASGKTFGVLLQDCRVEAARSMLESPALRLLTAAEIGFRAGFGDASHFVRVMRTSLGQSPAAYRKAFVAEAPDCDSVDVPGGDAA